MKPYFNTYAIGAADEVPVDTFRAPEFSSHAINFDRGFVEFTDSVCHIFHHPFVQHTCYSNYSSPVYPVKAVTHQAVVHVKIVTFTSDGESIPTTLTI